MEHTSNLQPQLTPDQELAYIRQVMTDSRRAFAEDGKPYIAWGLIVALGMLGTYIPAVLKSDFNSGYLWMALVLCGWGYIAYYVIRKRKEAPRARSFADRMQGAIWGACGTALGLGVILCMIQIDNGSAGIAPINGLYACFIASLILGIAYYLSGVANELKWLSYIGIIWWVGAIVMYFWVSIHVLLIYAVMLILFQVVPGILLNRKYRATQSHAAVGA